MPAPTPATGAAPGAAPGAARGLSASAGKFLKANAKFAYGTGAIAGLMVAGDIKGIMDADNKLKALLKTAKDFILIRVAMVGIFKGISDVVKGLVRDTGSLDKALERLTQVQQYARQFQAFTGSLSSARQKIAELHQLSTRGVFKFEDLVEANKSLQVFTRGAYTSVEATKTVGEAAIATGNSIQDTARAVGNFYDTLRSGGPVGAAAEQLRQMGVISESTAAQLEHMSEGGASTKATFDELTSALQRAAEGAAGYKDELQGVTEEHEKAVAELKTAFGAPWTQSDIQSTKNMSDGLKSITPVVGELSKSFAFLYNSASTFGSAFFKMVAGSKFVQKALLIVGEAIMAVSVAAGLFGAAVMIPLIAILLKFSLAAAVAAESALAMVIGLEAATIAATGLQIVLSTLLVGSVILMAVGFVAALAGVVVKAREEAKQAQKDFQDWTKALKNATAAILEQAAAVTTLASKYEALGKTMQQMSANQKELKALRKEERTLIRQIREFEEGGYGGEPTKLKQQLKINQAKQREYQRQQDILKGSREEQALRQPLHEQLIKQEADRQYFYEQQAKSATQRDQEARRGAKIAAEVEDKKSEVVAKRMQKETQMKDRQAAYESHAAVSPEELIEHSRKQKETQEEINKLKIQERDIGLSAPKFSAVQKEARAEQLRQAKKAIELEAGMRDRQFATTEDKLEAEARLKEAQLRAGPEAIEEYRKRPELLTEAEKQAQIATRREAEPPSPEEMRQERVQAFQIQTEMQAKGARLKGDVRTAQAAEDVSALTKSFETLLPLFGEKEAARISLAQTQQDIAGQYQGAAHVVSSMQAVGGGGNVSGVDPMLQSARRREELQNKMVELLGILTGQEPAQAPPTTFGQ